MPFLSGFFFLEGGMPRCFRPVIVAIFLLVATTNGLTQSRRIGFFIDAAGFFPAEKSVDTGYGSGMGGVFYFNSAWSLSIEWKYSRLGVEKEEGKFLDGTLTVTPLVASVRYSVPVNAAFSPYVFAGAGLFIASIRLSKAGDFQETNVRRQEIKNGLGFYGGIGSVIKLDSRLSLFIEGLYLQRTTDAETIYIDNSPAAAFNVNLSSFSILVGLSYFY
jgi:opacity protein-like surface antigen